MQSVNIYDFDDTLTYNDFELGNKERRTSWVSFMHMCDLLGLEHNAKKYKEVRNLFRGEPEEVVVEFLNNEELYKEAIEKAGIEYTQKSIRKLRINISKEVIDANYDNVYLTPFGKSVYEQEDKVIILTANYAEVVEHIIKTLKDRGQIAEDKESIVMGNETAIAMGILQKPNPYLFIELLDKVGLNDKDNISIKYYGDSGTDVKTVKNLRDRGYTIDFYRVTGGELVGKEEMSDNGKKTNQKR